MPRVSGAVALLSLALGVSVLAAPLTAQTAVAAPAALAAAPVAWDQCARDVGPPDAECATYRVPLDYDDPAGPKTTLDLLRMPATGDPADRIGTLFVNPGGPGGSARGFAYEFGRLVPSAVSARFDIVGIDPRGVGPTATMTCRTDQKRPRYPFFYFPVTKREIRTQVAFDNWQRRACRDGGNPIVDHMSTADTARDMDTIREAVGDPRLTYYGVSYGTQLGSTYAAMYPDNIRAMIVDGVLDPVEWSTGYPGEGNRPFSERLGSSFGAWKSLTSAFAECDRVGKKRCPIAGEGAKMWRQITRKLKKGPDRRYGVTYADVVGGALGMLYDPSGIRYLMREIKTLHTMLFRGGKGRVGAWSERTVKQVTDRDGLPGPYGWTSPAPGATGFGRISNPFAGVACADSNNPSSSKAWVTAAKRADRDTPWFGAAWSWASSSCAQWPASTKADRFTGPYEVTTNSPVLIVGNSHDPATPIHGARALHGMLAGSRLLRLDGWGHGAIGTGPCIRRIYGDYLVHGSLPAAGKVCATAKPLFPKKKR